jgi:hypothetical protein
MPTVEVYEKDELKPLLKGEFPFLPRVGDTISEEVGDYFEYYTVIEVWHRQNGVSGDFSACVRVKIND